MERGKKVVREGGRDAERKGEMEAGREERR